MYKTHKQDTIKFAQNGYEIEKCGHAGRTLIGIKKHMKAFHLLACYFCFYFFCVCVIWGNMGKYDTDMRAHV